MARRRNCAALPVWFLCFLSLGLVSTTCYFEPNILLVRAMWRLCSCRGINDEQQDPSNPEFQTGLGVDPDGARGPFPPGYRAPRKRWSTSRASSWACGTDAGADRRPGRAVKCTKPNRAFG